MQLKQENALNINAVLIVLFVIPMSYVVRRIRVLSSITIGILVATIGVLVFGTSVDNPNRPAHDRDALFVVNQLLEAKRAETADWLKRREEGVAEGQVSRKHKLYDHRRRDGIGRRQAGERAKARGRWAK